MEAEDGRVSEQTAAVLDEAERLTVSLGGTFLRRRADDPATEIVREAAAQAVTQLVVGESHRDGVRGLVGRSPLESVLRRLRGVDVLVVAGPRERRDDGH